MVQWLCLLCSSELPGERQTASQPGGVDTGIQLMQLMHNWPDLGDT